MFTPYSSCLLFSFHQLRVRNLREHMSQHHSYQGWKVNTRGGILVITMFFYHVFTALVKNTLYTPFFLPSFFNPDTSLIKKSDEVWSSTDRLSQFYFLSFFVSQIHSQVSLFPLGMFYPLHYPNNMCIMKEIVCGFIKKKFFTIGPEPHSGFHHGHWVRHMVFSYNQCLWRYFTPSTYLV